MLNADDCVIAAIEDPDNGLEDFWKWEHNEYVVRQTMTQLDKLENEFEPLTLQLFRQVVINERPIKEVAAEHNRTANAVYIAKLKVIRRLRQELAEILDDSE